MGKKLEVSLGNFFKFETVGDTISGKITSIHNKKGEFGEQTIIDLTQLDTGELRSVSCTSNLLFYIPLLHEGMPIRITYEGDEKNKKSKRTYRKYMVEDISDEVK